MSTREFFGVIEGLGPAEVLALSLRATGNDCPVSPRAVPVSSAIVARSGSEGDGLISGEVAVFDAPCLPRCEGESAR